jgi:hypothetical protein
VAAVTGDDSGFGAPTLHGSGVGTPIRPRPTDAPVSPERFVEARRRGEARGIPSHDSYLDPSGDPNIAPSADPHLGRPVDSSAGRARAVYRPPVQSIDRPLPPPEISESRLTRVQRERGLPGWAALLAFLAICGIGGVFDVINGSKVRGAFNVAIVVAAIVAILLVRRSAMFSVVIAPPLVYLGASAVMLFARGGLSNKQAIYDEATNWLVYGFPAIAGATAAVLLVAGVRLIINR